MQQNSLITWREITTSSVPKWLERFSQIWTFSLPSCCRLLNWYSAARVWNDAADWLRIELEVYFCLPRINDSRLVFRCSSLTDNRVYICLWWWRLLHSCKLSTQTQDEFCLHSEGKLDLKDGFVPCKRSIAETDWRLLWTHDKTWEDTIWTTHRRGVEVTHWATDRTCQT